MFFIDFFKYAFSSTIEVNYDKLHELEGAENLKEFKQFFDFMQFGTNAGVILTNLDK